MENLGIQNPPPFSTLAAPTAACSNPPKPEESRRFDTFLKFSELPTELRRKIWHMTIPDPRVVYVNYDVEEFGSRWGGPYCYSNGVSARRTWKIENGIRTENFAIAQVCQEARAETHEKLGKWEVLRLQENYAEVCMFNFETDTIFLGTSADVADSKYVLPPVFPLERDTQDKLQKLAISKFLWEDWEFEADYGSDASCEYSPAFGTDNTHSYFKEQVYRCSCISKFQLVGNSDVVARRAQGGGTMVPICLIKSTMPWLSNGERAAIIKPFYLIDEEAESFVFEEVDVQEAPLKEKKSEDTAGNETSTET